VFSGKQPEGVGTVRGSGTSVPSVVASPVMSALANVRSVTIAGGSGGGGGGVGGESGAGPVPVHSVMQLAPTVVSG
jgi:hypothetical protein